MSLDKHIPQFQHVPVSCISTGGSLEKDYPSGKGVEGFEFPSVSALPGIIERAGIIGCRSQRFKQIDSLKMDDTYREGLMLYALGAGNFEQRIVIVHGTDAMIETAEYFAAKAGDRLDDRVIVFTGSLRPAYMRETDADANIGSAIIAARMLPQGIYIAMHGQIFGYDQCSKSDSGTFHFKEGCQPFRLQLQ